ncbi:actin-like ATPase domain-containing protein [Cristinia sonorae]|uniref:Actin-like ATPase domain-containing protein n=1 Tax=Cristinia sonorae TaxID=1940300 RepID=A0A8K0XN47_9AGAR|nr:actin-like ATPase domain-containing protein [Cristinia sonorae]
MPRGIPNVKKDESAMRFTSFHVPLAINPKHGGGNYMKTESQTYWYRNAARANAANKGKGLAEDAAGASTAGEGRRGSKILVIHPGSRWLRIGRASDVNPVSIPSVIARKQSTTPAKPQYVENISRPQKDRVRGQPCTIPQAGDEYAVALASDDPFDAKVAAISISLRDRMRFYKLRVTPNAAGIASTFNDQFKPEIIPEVNDPFHIDWITESSEDVLIGDAVLRLSDPQDLHYAVRWPFYAGAFNTRAYTSNQLIASDVEALFRAVLREKYGIEGRNYHEYSVVLVIPDFYDRFYVETLATILLVRMGFKQLCAQQESLAATYGAGISNACVVDMGATKTSIACVDDGLVIAETRMTLNMGGDDITEFLHILLEKISFPCRDIDLARSYDWNVMEDLKARLCTLAEGDVALNLYDFVVRRPGQPTEKYGLRAYDEIILSPMCLFEPRVIEFDNKRAGLRPMTGPGVTGDIVDQPTDHVTNAMMISTQHLLPIIPPHTIISAEPPLAFASSGTHTPAILNNNTQPPDQGGRSQTTSASNTTPPATEEPAKETIPTVGEEPKTDEQPTAGRISVPPPTASASMTGEGTADAPMEISDTEGPETKPLPLIPQEQLHAHYSAQHQPTYPGGFAIDVCFEASKLPLDVAIFNSARAAGGDEKIRKYLQAVLVIGGTALVPGMAHALESRLQAIATPLVPNMEKVQIIPPPKDVDPRVLAWKGAAVLGRMDGVTDLWITKQDWDMFGMRGLKERCFYL